jgi:glutamate carboxypeptidase
MTVGRPDARQLLEWLRARRPAMVELLRRLVAAESPSNEPAVVGELLSTLAGELDGAGLSPRRVRAGRSAGVLYAVPRARVRGLPFQLLVGHCDTVWPVGTLRERPIVIDGNTLRGPGSFDMKGGLVQMIFALRALRELGLRPPATPVVFIDSDEELGSPGATRILRHFARRAARAFILEPAYGRAGMLKTERKAAADFTVVVKGRAAHAGVNPEEGASAILEMSHQIQRLFALNDPERGVTVNVGTIDGGVRPNVVAPEVQATVDVRVRSAADAQAIEAALRALTPRTPGTTVEVRGGFGQLPMEATPRNQALWRMARGLGRQLGLELEAAASGGVSDGNTTSRYTATLDGLGAVGAGAHAVDEQVDLLRMAERCALLTLLVLAPVDGGAP